MSEKLVSICCITYNQENYIAKAIDSFLSQSYIQNCEILIHDDASTDDTLSILKKYHELYPDLIRLFPETVNQYSRGDHQMFPRLFKEARGKYIAICEGDDYWSDIDKIKMQVGIMEKHAEYSMCFHAAALYDCNLSRVTDTIQFSKKSREVTEEEIITAGGCMIPTASLFFRKDLVESLPEFFYHAPVGDYPLQLCLASRGKAYYINRSMSIYRKYALNSISVKNMTETMNDRIIFYKKLIKMLQEFSKDTKDIYKDATDERIYMYKFEILRDRRAFIRLLRKPYRKYLFSKSYGGFFKVLISCIFPRFYCDVKRLVYKYK